MLPRRYYRRTNSIIGAAFTGFATGFSLILAIGAQNAFVFRQGLARSHVFWLCLLCAVSDAVLIAAGVLGFGAIVTNYPLLPRFMTWGGAIFLLMYGTLRFYAAFKGDYEMQVEGATKGLWVTLATGAALTWLNPHVYLDTLGLIGAISTGYAEGAARTAFGLAAILASFVFFFGLGYGARLLSPIMQSASAWRVLDVLIGIVIWLLAYYLIF